MCSIVSGEIIDELVFLPGPHKHFSLLLEDALSVLLTLQEVPQVVVPIPNSESSLPMGLLVREGSLILHVRFGYLAIPFPETMPELSRINYTTSPLVGAISFWFPFFKSTFEVVSIGKVLFPLSFFEEIFEEALIFLSRPSQVNSIPLYFTFIPLTHVDISLGRLPESSSVLLIVEPLPRIVFAIIPMKLTHFGPSIVDKFSFVLAFPSYFDSRNFVRTIPSAFIDPVWSNHDSLSIFFSIFYVSEVQSIDEVQTNSKMRTLNQILDIEIFVGEAIVPNEVRDIVLCGQSKWCTLPWRFINLLPPWNEQLQVFGVIG